MSDFGDDFRNFVNEAFGSRAYEACNDLSEALNQQQMDERRRREDECLESDQSYQEFSETYTNETIKEQDKCAE